MSVINTISANCGFPSPAEDYIESQLDLNQRLISHPSSTYFVTVDGNALIDVGILSGDLLVVDRALEPKNESIIIANLEGELTVKQLKTTSVASYLMAGKRVLQLTEDLNFELWGVVTYAIHTLK